VVSGIQSPAGVRPYRFCPRCGHPVLPEANFCASCGQQLYVPFDIPRLPTSSTQSAMMTIKQILRGVGTYTVLSLVAITILNIFILIWSIQLVLPQTPNYHTTLFIIVPWIVNLVELTGISFAIYHVLLVLAIVNSFILLIWKSRRLFIRELSVEKAVEKHSPLYVVGTIFFAVLFFNVIYYLILSAAGITPRTPELEGRELWKLLYGFASASVWEEIVSRMLLIGIPLLIIDKARRRGRSLKNYFLGGNFSLGKFEITFLIISSIFFSSAHFFSWDAFKLLPTFVAGLALGYLFLTQGIYASIMLHFMVDYLSIPTEVFSGLTSLILMGLIIFAWVAVGFLYFINYTAKAIGFLIGRKIWPDSITVEKEEDKSSTIYNPAQMDIRHGDQQNRPGSFGFACPYCGYTEARYRDGRFECLRCGRIIN